MSIIYGQVITEALCHNILLMSCDYIIKICHMSVFMAAIRQGKEFLIYVLLILRREFEQRTKLDEHQNFIRKYEEIFMEKNARD